MFGTKTAYEEVEPSSNRSTSIPSKLTMLAKKIKKNALYRKLVPKIPIREELKLSAWEKFIKYRRFPFKFCTHLILLALVTAQLFLFAGNREDYLSNAGKIIANNFLPEGYLSSKDAKNGYNTFYFDNCADIVTHIAWTVGQYYRLKDKAPTYLELTGRDGHGSYSLKPHANDKSAFMTDRKSNQFGVQKLSVGPSDKQQLQNSMKKQLYLQEIFEKKKLGTTSDEEMEVPSTLSHNSIPNPVEMLITRFTNMSLPIQNFQKKLNKDTTTNTFFLSVNDTFGPFTPFVDPDQPKIISDQEDVKIIDAEGLQKYMITFTEITLKFTYKNIFTQGSFPELLIWDIALSYDFSTGAGVIPVTLRYDVGLGLENEQDFNAANVLSSPLTWISILIIIFALFSTFLILRAIYRSFRFIKKAMRKDRSIFQMMLMESADDMDEAEQKSVDLQNTSVLSENTPLVGINSSPQTKPVAVKNAKKRFDEEMNESYGSAISGMTFTSQYYQHVLDKHQSELHQLQNQKEEDEFTPTKKVHLPGIPFRIVTGEIGVPTPEHIIAAKAELNDPNFKPKLKHKLKFFNPWHALGLISNTFCIVSSCMVFTNVTYQYFSLDATNILLGLSAIFMWANIVQYLSHSPKFYVLIKSLRKGLPNIGRFIIGAAPLLIGYALCGMVLFGSYTESFQGFQNSLITLFSAANGDALIDTFNSLFGQNSVIAYFSRVYLITFVCLFTYSVINIFILIMEDAYFSVKEANIKREAAEAAAQAVEEYKKGEGHTGGGSHGGDGNDIRSDSVFNDAGSWKKGAQIDEDDDVERLQDERSKIDVLINLLSELRSGQLLGDGEDQDPQYAIQQKSLSEKLTRLLVNRNLKKIRRKKSDPSLKSALSSSFRKFEVGSFGEKKKKETKFNLDLNESIDDSTLIEVYDEDDEMVSPTPPNL